MSGAINYGLMDDMHRIVDAKVEREIVDLDHVNEVDLTKTYDLVSNMSREECVVVVAAAVKKFPFEVYRTLALYAERGKEG